MNNSDVPFKVRSRLNLFVQICAYSVLADGYNTGDSTSSHTSPAIPPATNNEQVVAILILLRHANLAESQFSVQRSSGIVPIDLPFGADSAGCCRQTAVHYFKPHSIQLNA